METARKYAHSISAIFCETSARDMNDRGIEEVFGKVISSIIAKQPNLNEDNNRGINLAREQKSKGCNC